MQNVSLLCTGFVSDAIQLSRFGMLRSQLGNRFFFNYILQTSEEDVYLDMHRILRHQ